MKAYLDLLQNILDNGTWKENRTGVRTLALQGAHMRFDFNDGAAVLTTRKVFVKSFAGELVSFLRGATSAKEFRENGCNFWDANANVTPAWVSNPFRDGTDHLGEGIYGQGWRHWPAYYTLRADAPNQAARRDALLAMGYESIGWRHDGCGEIFFREIDQVADCLQTLLKNPFDRRIRFTAWNPSTLPFCALPACHTDYTWTTNGDATELSLHFTMRSVDVFLGLGGGNLTLASMLLMLFSRMTGMKPRFLTWTGADVHIYENHIEQVREQLGRNPLQRPRIVIDDRIPDMSKTGFDPSWLSRIEPGDFRLEGYECHPAIKAPMAA